MTYDKSGEPAIPAAVLERGGRYSSAWLIQRPRNDVPAEVNIQVLVFAGRSTTDTPSAETKYPALASPGQKEILIDLSVPGGGVQPRPVAQGRWIAFSMLIPPTPNTLERPYPTLDFYRVVGVNDDNPNTLIVELETPIKTQTPLALQPPGRTGHTSVRRSSSTTCSRCSTGAW